MSDTPRWLYAAYRQNLRRNQKRPHKAARTGRSYFWLSWPAYGLAYALDLAQRRGDSTTKDGPAL